MKFWLLWVLYFAMLNRVIKGQSTVNNGQPSNEKQHLAGLLNNIMQLVNQQQQQTRQLVQAQTQVAEQKMSDKCDRWNEVIIRLNQTVGKLDEKIDQLSQDFAQLNRTLVRGQYTDGQISQTLNLQNNAIRQMNENCARRDQVNICVNQTLVYDGHVEELGLKIELQNVINGQMNEKLDQQSQLLVHFNQTLNQQQENLEQVASSLLHHQKLALCSSIPRPIVHFATQSIKQTSNETVITYTCNIGYEFSNGLTTRSTTCSGTSWKPVDDNCIRPFRPVLTHVMRGDHAVYAMTSFNNQLFVTRRRSNSQIEVYDTTTFDLIRNITVSGAGSVLGGLARCPADNCLYVSDYYNHKVHEVNLSPTPGTNTAITTNSWSVIGGTPLGLSVNGQHNLLVALDENKKIAEYTPNGSLVRVLITDSNRLWHAVEYVVNGKLTLAVSRWGPMHSVDLTSVDGLVKHSYGSTTRGSGPGLMNHPQSLAVDRDGFVLAADYGNNRILLLNPTLSDARTLPLPTNATGPPLISGPVGLWLDELRGRLYVGEWNSPYRVLVFDNVFNIATLFTP